ncbi:oligosaccharide flippase family protein [Psychroflexus sp. YR1-1]|uniref:Oligosaccharide flippase family protein n=1 Tax=Psychroflexus aurantiacus TaxID=2709310 RepID=A0A6B3QX66_9FLAO|nr:oligosaccharide flippase family protein [Psychroflexus aurantiacus]NEV92733.1 oligosaccharide flippase family protein [Psychroflexus aurantiacus]
MESRDSKYFAKILLNGAFIVSLLEGSAKLVTLLLLPVFSKYLTPEDFGVFSLVVVIVSVLGLIYNPGTTSGTTRLYHDTTDKNEQKELIGSLFAFYIFIPFAFSIILIMVGQPLFNIFFKNFSFYPYGLMAILLALLMQAKNVWSVYLLLKYKIKLLSIYTFLSVIIGLVFAYLLVVVYEMGALGRVLAMFPPAIFLFIISLFTVYRYTGGKWSIKNMLYQFKFGVPLIGAIWSTSLLLIVDRYMLEVMTDVATVGIYAFAFQIGQIPQFFVLGIKKLWNPMFYENMNNNNYKIIEKLIFLFSSLLGLICILIILFSNDLFYLLIDERYYDSIPLVNIIVLGIFFSGLLIIPNSKLGYSKRFGLTSKIALTAFVINLLLNIILIKHIGAMGAALASVIAYFTYFLIASIIADKRSQVISTFKQLLLPIFFIILSLTFSFLYETSSFSLIHLTIKTSIIIVFLFLVFKQSKINYKQLKSFFKK